MMGWSVETEDALMTTYVHRYSVLGKSIEVRAVFDKVLNKYKLRFISIKPANETEVSLLTILTPHFKFTIDYVQDGKVVMIYPNPEVELFDDMQSITMYVDSLISLIIELISYSSNPLLRSEINYDLVSRGWILDLSGSLASMFKVYDTKAGIIRVNVELEQRQLELGKVRVDVLIRAITALRCMVNTLSNKGFNVSIIYDDLGIAHLTGEFPSLGILTLIALKIDGMINETEKSCS
ncbi:hypothetical protein [Vulcanisaeta souniana]|uniref:Uncharacterized protein n=1 Tax=Vulcanisaeta souniana JCM 11219 TaxID=1293586 RepID=A0A830E199_9CREN|nr:hypothetical protein [Vulcanisaeta souniana]BDR91361.1 hypothetical protein Vsou_04540 [Vulcanisaeta souniana JCM 11219]GGI72590.1 hypothetical protein GCM10007112_06760 [Vulcanisaeta souniana JCM 11219]